VATLSVLKFNDPHGAERVLVALQGMQERQIIDLEDAAVVSWPQGRKRPIIPEHPHQLAHLGALGGAFWGFLFGLIFFAPFLGAAAGAAGGAALAGSLEDFGIDEAFIKQVGEKVTEGTSALFVMAGGDTDHEKVVAELMQYDFEPIWTDMPEEQIRKLRGTFAG
jgi:uncharacterized membrane protein